MKTGKILGIVAYEDGKTAGERANFDPVYFELYDAVLDEEFYDLPGIAPINRGCVECPFAHLHLRRFDYMTSFDCFLPSI